ncbi:MAG: FKBP-type peptidyl-prolyl cis-trans isomerase [Verrucomicrobiota bacterium]
MKFATQLSAGLASLGLLVAASAQDPVKFEVPGVTTPAKPAAPAPASKASTPAPAAAPAATPATTPGKKTYTDAQIAEAYGWFVGAQMGLRQLEFTREQVEAMARGMVGVASGAQPPFDAREIGPEVEAFLARKNQVFMGKLRAVQLAEGTAYMNKLKENKNVVELPSGLRYEIVQAGKGAVPKPGQIVTIHYTGSLVNGQVFDTSRQPRQPGAQAEPAELLLREVSPQNPQGVIAGMFEGIQKTGAGGKLKLHIPPSLAYGDEGAGSVIPPGATLVFDVEILAVKDAPAAPAAK